MGATYSGLFLPISITRKSSFIRDFGNPGCSGVDFFVQNLTGENCLVVPPVNLIHRKIHYLYTSRAVATLVVPFWPLSHFWPIIGRNVLVLSWIISCLAEGLF